jgi:hypothetical protein
MKGFAKGGAADLEMFGKLGMVRELLADFQLPVLNHPPDLFDYGIREFSFSDRRQPRLLPEKGSDISVR